MRKWAVAGAVVGLLLFATTALAADSHRLCDYTPSARFPYGGKWKTTKPSGLPASARKASARGAAYRAIDKIAREEMRSKKTDYDENIFARTLLVLAENESRGTFALPAEPFNLRPEGSGGEGSGSDGSGSDGSGDPSKAICTAWGVFQWIQTAWNELATTSHYKALCSTPPSRHPWTASAFDEILYPVRRYSQIYRTVLDKHGSSLHAAYAVLLWHQSPTSCDLYNKVADAVGFDSALIGWYEHRSLDRSGDYVNISAPRKHDRDATRLLNRVFSRENYTPLDKDNERDEIIDTLTLPVYYAP
jgi:hypothetical protein